MPPTSETDRATVNLSAFGGRVEVASRPGHAVLRECLGGRALPVADPESHLVQALLRGAPEFAGSFEELAYVQLARFYLLDDGRLSRCLDYGKLVPSLGLPVRPTEASFVLTKLCNLKCVHCYNDSGLKHPHELTHDEKLGVVDALGRWGVAWLTLTGGEPTLDPAFDAILALAARYCMAVKVSTNGWQLPASLLRAISDRVVAQVNISLDGVDAATHDEFRRREGSYARVMRSLLSLRSTPPPMLVFNVSIHRRSLPQMEALTRVAIENAATAVSFKPVVSTGRRGIRDDFTLSEAQLADFKAERDRLRRLYGAQLQIDGKLLAEEIKQALLEPVACAAGEAAMFIDADGRMLPCEAVAYMPDAPTIRGMTPMHAWLEAPAFTWFREVRSKAIGGCGSSGGCGTKGCPGTQARGSLRPPELVQLGS